MVAESAPREFAFIIATDEKKPDGKTRRMIRREVMKGKNKGKTLPPRRPKVATARCSQTAVEQSSPPSDHSTPSSSTMSLDIPARVGSDMSFYLVAGERIDASVLTPIIKCKSAHGLAISVKIPNSLDLSPSRNGSKACHVCAPVLL